MATQKKTAEVDYSMQEKILALYDLQKIDSQIDSINKVKGELPLEVQDLDDELAGLKARVENINAEIEELNALSKQRKREVDQAKILIGNYKEQQNNVRNNREFDAITKEIELAEKRLKEYAAGIKVKKAQVEETEALMAERRKDLEAKQAELQSIEAETASQVAEFTDQAAKAQAKIDERLLEAYQRIRRNVRNGLAVVTVRRDACGGCFNRIPPQRQMEIRQGKKIIICEYCGRILVADPEEQQ